MINLNLYDNALDSYRLGIDAFIKGEENPLFYKLAIKELFCSFELILKELLSQEHESLIYVNVEDVAKKFDSRKTVDFTTVISRLKSISKVDLPDKYIKAIKALQKQRNNIQHYKIEMNKNHAADIIASTIPIMIYILNEYFEEETNLRESIGEIYFERLMEIEKSSEKITTEAHEKFKSDGALEIKEVHKCKACCPVCNSEVVGQIDDVKCYCCGRDYDINEFFDYYAQIVSEIDHDTVTECPECNYNTMYRDDSEGCYICLHCKHKETEEYCEECLEKFPISSLKDITNYFDCEVPDRIIYKCYSCII